MIKLLVHYQDVVMKNWEEWKAKAELAGIKNGFVPQGYILEV